MIGRVSRIAVIAAWLAAGAAGAQTVVQDGVPAPVEAAPEDGDIIVTAQRRAQSTTDVPISLTVRSGEQLATLGIDTIRDLHIGTPGLRIDRNGVSVQPSIRGITALDGNPGNDANVAIYIDGVYRPNPAANNIDLPDVEQIEILKGPQGTLFGRNATGGAIRITTLRPSYDTAGSLTLGYGSFDDVVAKGSITGPIVADTVAAALSGFYQRNDGYLNDLTRGGRATGGLESFLVRGKLLVEPAAGASVLLAAHYSNRSDGSLAGQPFRGNTVTRGTPGVIIPTRAYDIANNDRPRVDAEEFSVSANATIDIGAARLNSITAYNHVDVYGPVEGDYTNIDRSLFFSGTRQKTFSQELTLSSRETGAFDWQVGLFYYDDDAFFNPLRVTTNGVPFDIYGRQTTKAYAAFGEIDAEVLSGLHVIAGLRYSHEKRALSGAFGARRFPQIADKTFKDLTPRVSARYEFADGSNVYGTFSQGFKSGGFSASSLNPRPFEPEQLTAYEIGYKTPSRGALRGSIAAFYYDYTDQQVQAATTLANGSTVGTTTNAASSEIYGAEFEGTAEITRSLSVLATVSLLHARYSRFPNAFAQVPISIGGVACLCGNTGVTIDATGNQLVRAPDFTSSVTADYTRDLGIGRLKASATYYHSSRFFFTPDNRVGQPAYDTLGARLSLTTLDRAWTFTVYGRNLTSETVLQGASILPTADGVLFAPPRILGIEVRRAF